MNEELKRRIEELRQSSNWSPRFHLDLLVSEAMPIIDELCAEIEELESSRAVLL